MANEKSTPNLWILDSGATHSFSNSRKAFFKYKLLETSLIIKVDGSETHPAVGTGTILLGVNTTNDRVMMRLGQALYCPDPRRNIISMSSLLQNGWSVNAPNAAFILSNSFLKIDVHLDAGLLVLDAVPFIPFSEPKANVALLHKNPTLQQAHEALGHINKKSVQKLIRNHGLRFQPDHVDCESCIRRKMNRASYRSRPQTAKPQ